MQDVVSKEFEDGEGGLSDENRHDRLNKITRQSVMTRATATRDHRYNMQVSILCCLCELIALCKASTLPHKNTELSRSPARYMSFAIVLQGRGRVSRYTQGQGIDKTLAGSNRTTQRQRSTLQQRKKKSSPTTFSIPI